jgi:hypothetical protein
MGRIDRLIQQMVRGNSNAANGNKNGLFTHEARSGTHCQHGTATFELSSRTTE